MSNKKIINILTILIVILTVIVSLVGLITSNGVADIQFISVFGEKVKLYGTGIYQNNSVSVVAQGLAQDLVSIIIGLPVLVYCLFLFNKGLLKGKLLLSGMLAYFLYTYMSYTFLWIFNPLFLFYVAIMSLSLFALILVMLTVDIKHLKSSFKETLPVKTIGGFQITIGIAVSLMWLVQVVPASMSGNAPILLEHYTTLVIQAMDLGLVVPIAITSGILLIKKNNYGYLLASVVIIKTSALLISITAMIFSQMLMEVNFSPMIAIIFIVINILVLYPLHALLKNLKNI